MKTLAEPINSAILLFQGQSIDLWESFSSLGNPIYISAIVIIIFVIILILTYKVVINPITESYNKEKENLELKSAKLMAQFAELDPDPLLRIDSKGYIIESNNAAIKVFNQSELKSKNIDELIPFFNFDIRNFIEINGSISHTTKISDRYYLLLLRGEAELKFAQLFFRDITELVEIENRMAHYQKRLRELSDHIQFSIEEERTRIARNLHDGIGQNLSLLRMNLLKLKDTNSGINHYEIDDAIFSLEEAISELKTISYSLKPKLLEELGLGVSISHLVNRATAHSGVKYEFQVVGNEIRLDNKVEITVFRMVQEALNNMIKYSLAANFSVQLIYETLNLKLIIADDGTGFNFKEVIKKRGHEQGMGLFNMMERVETLGGIFKVESSSETGTILIAEIPIREFKYAAN
jgi:signal transduction histidine kinase